jgi:hypothetical protein
MLSNPAWPLPVVMRCKGIIIPHITVEQGVVYSIYYTVLLPYLRGDFGTDHPYMHTWCNNVTTMQCDAQQWLKAHHAYGPIRSWFGLYRINLGSHQHYPEIWFLPTSSLRSVNHFHLKWVDLAFSLIQQLSINCFCRSHALWNSRRQRSMEATYPKPFVPYTPQGQRHPWNQHIQTPSCCTHHGLWRMYTAQLNPL